MAAGVHSNMAAVGNNKSIGSSQNSLVIFKVVEGTTLNKRKPRSMICLQTRSFRWSFQDGRQLASKPAHHKQRVARPSPFIRSAEKLLIRAIYACIATPRLVTDLLSKLP